MLQSTIVQHKLILWLSVKQEKSIIWTKGGQVYERIYE